MDSNLNKRIEMYKDLNKKKKRCSVIIGKMLLATKEQQKERGHLFTGKDFEKNLEKKRYTYIYSMHKGTTGIGIFEFLEYCKTIGLTHKETIVLFEEIIVSVIKLRD